MFFTVTYRGMPLTLEEVMVFNSPLTTVAVVMEALGAIAQCLKLSVANKKLLKVRWLNRIAHSAADPWVPVSKVPANLSVPANQVVEAVGRCLALSH